MDKEKSVSFNIHVPAKNNKLLQKALRRINDNPEFDTLWQITNVNALERWKLPDHGKVHVQIVANIALKIARMLSSSDVSMSVVEDFGLTDDHAELVVVLASLLHDIGMSIGRFNHETFSLFLANRLLHQILDFLPPKERTIVVSEVLHSIISHRTGGKPVTKEAGIVRVADALDMKAGRSRIPYEAGQVNIHSLSATAIEDVQIKEGKEDPVLIEITMNNSVGVFQVDELLKNKLYGSGVEKYISVKAFVRGEGGEKNLLKEHDI